MRRALFGVIAVASSWAACKFDWDAFDPRQGVDQGGSTTTGAGAGGGATTSSGGVGGQPLGGGGAGGEPTMTVTYVATVAECIEPTSMTLSPDQCEADVGPGNLKIDSSDVITLLPSHGYLRFDLDGTLTSHTVLTVTLRLVTTDNVQAPGLSSGDVWEVEPFALPDLSVAPPAIVSAQPLAADLGPLAMNQTVDFALPPSIAVHDSGVFLTLVPHHEDGVAYWNLDGLVPPKLIVEYR